jgi:phosphopantothenoylcysteine decarboxylase/phosphopantothenate--cysteine ligase
MYDAVMQELPNHDILIMAAAVADYRPKTIATTKLGREGSMTLELEATEDIVASAAKTKSSAQRIVGFSLESEGNLDRARQKLQRKGLDMIVFNPLQTMNSPTIAPTLLYKTGQAEPLAPMAKEAFAAVLIAKATSLFF